MTGTTGTDLPARFLSIESTQPEHARVENLLAGLQQSARSVNGAVSPERQCENNLAVVRLGIATSLFYALRAKHAPTAAHGLRVALNCSAWCERMGLDAALRDRIEVAALLHDVGKIGIPDRILRKPGKLTVEEQLVIDRCPELGCEILQGCTGDPELLEIVRYTNTWYSSRRDSDGPRGDVIPFGARMLSIADAFDAMTTDSVYRPAMSRERAIQELIDCSRTQFDPELAFDFYQMLEQRPEMLNNVTVNRWLQRLPIDGVDVWGSFSGLRQREETAPTSDHLFFGHLVDSLKDGVVFTDAEGTILQWNAGMRSLTSVNETAIVGKCWSSQSIGLRERNGEGPGATCLVQACLKTGSVVARPMVIRDAKGNRTPVHVQVSPVTGPKPGIHGTVLVIRDLSDRANLEEQLESLHRQTTRDPLTGIYNRAHFDAALENLTQQASDGGASFSLVICDIDHFKRVNDVHGHLAGDEALVGFAGILQAHSREEDIVARYGGEEFLLLTPNCDNATAARRAEAIRVATERTSLPSLRGELVTASFGVTEFQAGDTAETVLARADRALLKAKDNGRNRVIQLGTGKQSEIDEGPAKRGWRGWLDPKTGAQKQEYDVVTPVPAELAIEKLRGFIADHDAEIISVRENQLCLKLVAACGRSGRRRGDRRIAVRIELTLSEVRDRQANTRLASETNVHVQLQPLRTRDRRNQHLNEAFTRVTDSLRSYLMGKVHRPKPG
jgi:diguanylate cyclase (GGDEF)-like protein/PAS domain S-box-containing protein